MGFTETGPNRTRSAHLGSRVACAFSLALAFPDPALWPSSELGLSRLTWAPGGLPSPSSQSRFSLLLSFAGSGTQGGASG